MAMHDESAPDAIRVDSRPCAAMPWTLAIGTAAPTGGMAIAGPAGTLHEVEFAGSAQHASHLTILLDAVCQAAGMTPADLELVVVDRGPGSHTGVRIGLTAARLLAWQTGASLVGVLGNDALARRIRHDLPADASLAVGMPHRRGEMALALYPAMAEHPLETRPERVMTEAVPERLATLSGPIHLAGEALLAWWSADSFPATDAAQDSWQARVVMPAEANLAHRAWPTPADLLLHGRDLAESLPDLVSHASHLEPLYLMDPPAKTLAQRRKSGGFR